MSRQEIAEILKWAAVEIETGRPNWSEVMRAGVELIRAAWPLAKGQIAKHCAQCGKAL